MTTIKINVTNKTAICQKRYLISANSNYQIKFTFDDEWSLSDAKTARIVFDAEYYDILFTGDTVMLPKIPACKTLAVGVFTDQLATNLAELGCIISAADFDGTTVTEFTESQYDQIVGLLNKLDLRQIQSIARGKDTLIVGYNNMTFDVLPLYDGVGIETAGLNENGELLLTLTNSTTINCGSALGPKGDKGDKGDTGAPFTYSDFTDEQLAGLKGPKGDKGNKGDPFTYSDFTEEQLEALQGPKGDKGEKGDKGDKGDIGETPVLSIGTVTTVDPTEQADISLSGSAENPVLNLRIPKGEKGEGAEEIAQGIENFSKDMAGLDTKVSALSHQMAYAVRGYRDMSEYITNEALDANMDNLVLSETAVIPEKMYIKYTGTKVLNIGSGFDGRTQVREVAFARDISFRQGLPSFANCTSLEKIT
ncbi:MAG: collagen-like protein, partial [Oscillospiraceae bacterium]|nr:collagen-like protein [Oscillospiraceae bacterium]